jgi:hypothetical protein
MTPDLTEEVLRESLGSAADAQAASYADIDPAAVLATGHRVLRRRRMVATGGTMAAALVLGAGAWAVLGNQPGTDDRTLPATSIRPEPSGGVHTAELSLASDLVGADGTSYEGPTRVRVDVDTDRGAWQALVGGTEVPGAGGSLPADGSAVWSTGSQPFVVGLVPATATRVLPVWEGDSPTLSTALRPVPGTSWQAVVLWVVGPRAGSRLVGLDWTDGTEVRRGDGSVVPSTSGDGVLVYVDEDSDQFGVLSDDGATVTRLSDARTGHRPLVALWTIQPGSDTQTSDYAMLLPDGATDVKGVVSAGATLESSAVWRLAPGSGAVFVARLSAPKDLRGTGIDEVTWTGADGTPGSAPGD